MKSVSVNWLFEEPGKSISDRRNKVQRPKARTSLYSQQRKEGKCDWIILNQMEKWVEMRLERKQSRACGVLSTKRRSLRLLPRAKEGTMWGRQG